ncbi:MAG TPA: hypothetical protein VF390_01785 [Patescibacteria group bacterium]
MLNWLSSLNITVPKIIYRKKKNPKGLSQTRRATKKALRIIERDTRASRVKEILMDFSELDKCICVRMKRRKKLMARKFLHWNIRYDN